MFPDQTKTPAFSKMIIHKAAPHPGPREAAELKAAMTPGPAGPSLQHCGHPHQHLTPAGSEASVLGEGEDPVPKRPTSAFQRASLFLVQLRFCFVQGTGWRMEDPEGGKWASRLARCPGS